MMYLVFLYIDCFQAWKEQPFSFSGKYQVQYTQMSDLSGMESERLDSIALKEMKIVMRKTADSPFNNQNIYDIQLIVGRNGAGKSTLMNVLAGCTCSDRQAENENRWFAVYVSDTLKELGYYSVLLEGNDNQHRIVNVYKADEKDGELKIRQETDNNFNAVLKGKKCNYLIYRQLHEARWYREVISASEERKQIVKTAVCEKDNIKIPRIVACTNDKAQVFDMAWQAVHTQGMFALKNMLYYIPQKVVFRIELGHNKQVLPDLPVTGENVKNRFVNTLCHIILQSWADENEHPEIPIYVRRSIFRDVDIGLRNSNRSYADYMYTFFETLKLDSEKEKIKDLLELFNKFPREYFADDSTFERSIVDVNEEQKNWIYQICSLIRDIEVWGICEISISNLSNGEVQMLNLFSSIYGGLKHAQPDSTCILLLDEPDYGFHPEWSRNLIYYLKTILSQSPFKEFGCTYQILITTHSPILLSDVPPDNITIIHGEHADFEMSAGRIKTEKSESYVSKDREKTEIRPRIVEKSKPGFGFMSNISDLMKTSFFMDSLYGENARQYANKLIKDIIQLQKDVNEIKPGQFPNDNSQLEIHSIVDRKELFQRYMRLQSAAENIGEPVIREQMNSQLQRIYQKLDQSGITLFTQEEIDKRIQILHEELKTLHSLKNNDK